MTSGITLHVIYGIACAGKSTTALRRAADNGIRAVISTDYLREVQRLYVPANRSPALAKVSHTAWELSGDPTPDGIIAGFSSHAEAVFPADVTVRPVLLTVESLPQLLAHITEKEQQRAPGSEPRNWRGGAGGGGGRA